ncbi:MAG: hypothetical protein ACXADC_15115 [Candidatus Thorarchaeota archaeon]|jgi:hypothetical protein
MPIPHHRFGKTTIARVNSSDELKQIMKDPLLESETIIIKPNWVTSEQAAGTDADSFRIILESLDSRIVVAESHIIARAPSFLRNGGPSFTVGEKEVNWKWLSQGDGWNWLIENPDMNWFKKEGHWDQIKKEDMAFLDENGFTDLLNEFDVTYINVTDEVWSGRVANPTEVKELVETRFEPTNLEDVYNIIPQKLFDLRGSTFLSLARVKMYATFTLKNLFGMFPEPVRSWWHGLKESRFVDSFLDINKVYHSLYNMYGICEAFSSLAVPHDEGDFNLQMPSMRYNILEGRGFVVFGSNLVELDTILLGLTEQLILQDEKTNREPIRLAQDVFGAVDENYVTEAKQKAADWVATDVRVKPQF